MNKSLFILTGLVVMAFAGCEKDKPEPEHFVVADINTGVMLDGREIIMLNSNVGAEYPGDPGSYVDWEEALESCPEGYHLMKKAEAEAIMEEFDTLDKLRNGILKMPLTGCYTPPSTLMTIREFGFYHLAERYDDKRSWYFCFGTYNSVYAPGGEWEIIDVYFDMSKTRYAARCVKDINFYK